MGQEIVYCSKCQKRILGADYAKGLAFELENTSCCSACAVQVLEGLPPKAKEQLLSKMVKAGYDKHSQSSRGSRSSSFQHSTRSVPTISPDRRPIRPASAPWVRPAATIGVGLVAVLAVALALSGGGSPADRPLPPPPRAEVAPGLPPTQARNPEDRERDHRAKEALEKVRNFAQVNPKDVEGLARQWRVALLEAQGTGYEAEAKREVEKADVRAKEALGEEIAHLRRDVQESTSRREFKTALDLLEQARPRHGSPDWTGSLEALGREVRETASRTFLELKTRAMTNLERGEMKLVEEAKAQVARWGFPEYTAELEVALVPAWIPIFDGKTTEFMGSGSRPFWKIEGGALVHVPRNGDAQMGQSRENFADGEFRFRIRLGGPVGNFSCGVREGARRAIFYRSATDAPGAGDHEVILTCRGPEVSATLDGKPTRVESQGNVPSQGRLTFNYQDESCGFLGIEYRPLH